MSETDQPSLIVEVDGPIAVLTLARPDKLNALDLELLVRIRDAALELHVRHDVHVVVLRGAGTAFCAGADLAYVDGIRAEPVLVRRFLLALRDAVTGLERMRQPVVASVHGMVLAGGLELMLGCDLVVAAASTRIGDQHMNWGFIPGGGSTQRLQRWIGPARARDLLYTGRWISAAEAAEFGLVARVVADEELAGSTAALVGELAARSPEALAVTKRLVRFGADAPLAEGLDAEIDAVAAYYEHPAFEQGLDGFKSRTPPRYG